jgi:hypothetical protein
MSTLSAGLALVVVVGAAARAAGQAMPPPAALPAPPASPAPAPPPAAAMTADRARQSASDARYKVRIMEGVLEKSVQQAALRLNEQLQRVSPDLIQLTGAAHARGYRLEGYGLFFDVEVPAAMRQTMGWTARVMRQQQHGVSEALVVLKKIAGDLEPEARAEAERAMQQIELVVTPLPARVRSVVEPSPPAARPAAEAVDAAVGAAVEAAAPAPPPGTGVDAPAVRVAPPESDALLWRRPDLAYEEQVREALIGAMLEWGALLPVGPDEWLTVAARDNQDVIMPGQAPDVVTIILRVKGSDLAERLAGRLPLEELRRRVDVREF